MKKIKIVAPIIGAVALVGIGAGTWAVADAGGERVVRGVCAATTYELEVEEDDGLFEGTFELQSSAPRETWDVVITQDGTTILRGDRITDEDGELDVDFPADAEAEELSVTASPADGEPCLASLTR